MPRSTNTLARMPRRVGTPFAQMYRLKPQVKADGKVKKVSAQAEGQAEADLNAFETLSVEIRQLIASNLDDKDLATYRLVCQSTKSALDEDEGSFWRTRFLNTFDYPENIPIEKKRSKMNEWFKKKYQYRKHTERQRFEFQVGNSQREVECLSLIKDLINESFNINTHTRRSKEPSTYSLNMSRLEAIVGATGLLECVFRRPHRKGRKSLPNPVLLAIQLVLTHMSLTVSLKSPMAKAWRFSDSQTMAYASTLERPIFKGANCLEVDVEWTLHIANFFKNHLLSEHELTHVGYDDLHLTERPQCWTKPLSTSPLKLGKHWKGSYAYVDHDEIHLIRQSENGDYPIPDHMCGEGSDSHFQDLCLDFPKEKPAFWPPNFEAICKARSRINYHTATTRAQSKVTGPEVVPATPVSFSFKGDGEDANEPFLASGFFNPLPPQHGIPGWHRMTMMKYWRDEDGVIDEDSLWAYEGVVLPGSMVMLGRWWHPSGGDDAYTGPFIFWNVDASILAYPEETSAAV
ncbi:hypothetical protein E4T42_04468 [Aureobasidium subglaciale]|nr:hypothetical protein E4T42_04468 [Aureobasidium subglaciale]